MTEYTTLIEYNSDSKQYRAIIKDVATNDIIHTTNYNFNSEQALKEAREYFLTHKPLLAKTSFNSTIQPVNNSTFPSKPRSCCGR